MSKEGSILCLFVVVVVYVVVHVVVVGHVIWREGTGRSGIGRGASITTPQTRPPPVSVTSIHRPDF
jgi:amino acid transporter